MCVWASPACRALGGGHGARRVTRPRRALALRRRSYWGWPAVASRIGWAGGGFRGRPRRDGLVPGLTTNPTGFPGMAVPLVAAPPSPKAVGGRLLSVTNAIEAGTCRQGDSGWALAGQPGGGGGTLPPSNASLPPPPPVDDAAGSLARGAAQTYGAREGLIGCPGARRWPRGTARTAQKGPSWRRSGHLGGVGPERRMGKGPGAWAVRTGP